MLKAIGFWNADGRNEVLPEPQELVGTMATELRTHLADYLAAGMTHNAYLGFSRCRFGCGISDNQMGSRDLTDGVWLWPEGLAHYVRHHGILLPSEFLEYASTRATPRRPGWPDDDLGCALSEPLELVDQQYWIDWCAVRRSPVVLEKLRTQHDAAFMRARDESVARRKAETAGVAKNLGEVDGLSKLNFAMRLRASLRRVLEKRS